MRKSTIFSSGSLRRQIFRVMGLGIAGIFSFSVANAQLASGTYYINGNQPTGGNSYQSFAAFFTALSNAGNAISSPGILLKVVPQTGGYNEQFTIPSISGLGPCGTGCEARLIIRGDGTSDTRIHYSANSTTHSYSVVHVQSTYISLDSITVENTATTGYNYAVKLNKGAHYFNGTNSRFKSRNNGYSSGYSYSFVTSDGTSFVSGDPTNANNFLLDNCVIDGGYYGMYIYGGSSSSGSWPAGNTIQNCTFENWYYYGVYTRYVDDLTVHNNLFDASNTGVQYDYAAMIYYTNNSTFTNNRFDSPGAYAMRFYYCNYYNTVSGQFLVANNSVHGNQKYTYNYAMYFYRGQNFSVHYNSINMSSSLTSTTYPFYTYFWTGSNNYITNNVILNNTSNGTKYGYYLNNSTVNQMDYNTYYNENNATLTYYHGGTYSGLSALQSGTGTNANSQEADPSFVAADDLHVNGANLYAKGTPVAAVTTDIDGTTRSATAPSHGVHEFIPPQNDAGVTVFASPVAVCADTGISVQVTVRNFGIQTLTSFDLDWSWTGNGSTSGSGGSSYSVSPGLATGADTTFQITTIAMTNGAPGYNFMAYTSMPNNVTDENFENDTAKYYTQTAMDGAYTIGGTSPDFATFNDAVTGLSTFGVCGPVTFYARAGTYTERVEINSLVGTSAINTVTFTTDTNNTGPVNVEYTSTSSSDAGVFKIDGSSYITIDGYDIENLQTGSYADVIWITGNSHDITLSNNTISNSSTSFNSRPLYVYTYGFSGENIHVMNNDISGGYYCAYFYGYDGSGPGLSGLMFNNNNVGNAYYYGVYMSQFKDAQINYNNVDQVGGSSYVNSYGMMLYGYGSNYELIGNRVHAGYYGMYCYYMSGTSQQYSSYINNKVMIGDTATGITNGYYGLYFYQSGFFNIAHNLILSQTTNGYTCYLYGGLNHVHNNIFGRVNSGTNLYINGSYTVTDMDNNAYLMAGGAAGGGLSYSQGLGFDANGVEVATLYDNLDSLFTCNDTLVGAGVALAYAPYDIDMGGRSVTAPTIGPHEYVTTDAFTLGGDQKICDGDTLYLGSNLTGATYSWNTGDTTGVIMVTQPGTYSVTVNGGCANNAQDEVEVESGAAMPDFIPDSSWMTITFQNTSQNTDSWVWDFGDGTSSTDENPVHLYTTPGIYTVCLTGTGPCDDDQICKDVRAWDGVGVAEFDANNAISIYPNPASDVLTITTDGVPGNVLSIEISNVAGQVVLTSQLNDFNGYVKEDLDINKLQKGVYLVKIFTNEVVSTKRLVVNK